MVGDTTNDMQFGRKLGMRTILIEDDPSQVDANLYDTNLPGLVDFSRMLSAID